MTARRLEGRVALITGAARGQGRAHAVRLASEGADVIAVDVNASATTTAYPGPTPDDLAETVRLVEAQDRRIVAREADVRDFAALSAAVTEGVAELGRLDVVVANAGICSAGLSWELSLEQWQETIDVNLTGVFHTAKVAIPSMIEAGRGGSILFTSSIGGLKGIQNVAHYVACKHGIRVNTLHPHGVATGMTVDDLQPLIGRYAATLGPIFMQSLPDQVSQPEDMAAAVAWLASDEARHVTGIQLPVDLGTLTR